MEKYDLVIIGLGAMGSAALYHAADRGLNVLGIDQFAQVPHTNGSHHGSTRIIRQAYFEHPSYVPLVQHAYRLWNQLEQATGNRIFVKTGGLMVGERDSEVVSGAIKSAHMHGLAYELLSQSQVAQRFPHFHLSDKQVAVLEPDAGYLLCEEAVRDHVKQAVACGAQTRLGCKVSHWRATSSGVQVEVNGGTVHADKLILTVGAWAPEWLPSLPLAVERQVVFWFRPNGQGLQGIGLEGEGFQGVPIYIVEEAEGYSYYGFPEIAGQGAKVALHHSGRACTPETLDRRVKPEEVERMREVLARRIPSIATGELLETSVCMYTNTPDMHFVIGEHPEHPNVTLGLGFSGHGFKFSSAIGEQLVRLACGEAAPLIPPLFSPTRWATE